MKQRVKTLREAFVQPVVNTNWQGVPDGAPFNTSFGGGGTSTVNGVIQDRPFDPKDINLARPEKVLPYPLDRITSQLVDSYEKICDVRTTIILTLNSGIINKNERYLLRKQLIVIKKMLNTIKSMSNNVEQITL